MHAYLATICRDVGTELVHVGGVADHVHIVTTLPRILSQAQLIKQIKKTSSKWIKAVIRGIARSPGSAAMAHFQ
jgi:putative transposase